MGVTRRRRCLAGKGEMTELVGGDVDTRRVLEVGIVGFLSSSLWSCS